VRRRCASASKACSKRTAGWRQQNAELREELAVAYGHQREARSASPTADHAG
jgi:hypothetical protein